MFPLWPAIIRQNPESLTIFPALRPPAVSLVGGSTSGPWRRTGGLESRESAHLPCVAGQADPPPESVSSLVNGQGWATHSSLSVCVCVGWGVDSGDGRRMGAKQGGRWVWTKSLSSPHSLYTSFTEQAKLMPISGGPYVHLAHFMSAQKSLPY